jgi:hypothetical protein
MAATVDDRFFRLSMKLMAQVPRKNAPDVLNKSVLKVAIGAKGTSGLVQLTQKATRARIESDLRRNKLGIKLAVRWLKKRGEPITPQSVSAAYEAIRKARVQSGCSGSKADTIATAQHTQVRSGHRRGFISEDCQSAIEVRRAL